MFVAQGTFICAADFLEDIVLPVKQDVIKKYAVELHLESVESSDRACPRSQINNLFTPDIKGIYTWMQYAEDDICLTALCFFTHGINKHCYDLSLCNCDLHHSFLLCGGGAEITTCP